MKRSASLLAACCLAVAALCPARAADISAPAQPLQLEGNIAGNFGDTFGANNNGNTFSDRYTFTVDAFPFNVDALVASVSRSPFNGLDISNFGVYSAANDLVLGGFPLSGGALDVWQLTGGLLDPGSYYVQVDGTVVSNDSASYAGAVLLTPVPEPAMLGMLAGGVAVLALLGGVGRRAPGWRAPGWRAPSITSAVS